VRQAAGDRHFMVIPSAARDLISTNGQKKQIPRPVKKQTGPGMISIWVGQRSKNRVETQTK